MKARLEPKARRVWVLECPTCRKPIDWSGEGGIYFKSKKDAKEQSQLWWGNCDFKSLTEYCGCTGWGGGPNCHHLK